MGLRSPQQLEKAKAEKARPNQTEVKAFQDTSVTDALNTGMQSYNVQFNRNLRKTTAAKTSFKNQINRVAKEAEARLGGLQGDEVISKAPKIFEETQKEYKKLYETVPPELQGVFAEEKDRADISLNSKYIVKSYTEETKRLEAISAQNIKTAMDELSNKISLVQDGNQGTAVEFRQKIGELDASVRDSFINKGFDVNLRAEELKQEQTKVRSKALLQGIETFASSKRTDLIDIAQKTFDIYGDSPEFMTPADKEAAFKALNAGRQSAKGEIAYSLAEDAIKALPANASLYELESVIFKGTQDASIVTMANGVVRELYNSRERAKKDQQIQLLNDVTYDLKIGKPEEAQKKLNSITDAETYKKAVDAYNEMSRGNIISNPDTVTRLEQMFIRRPEDFDRVDLSKEMLSNRDRQMFETKKQIAAKKKSDSRYGLLTGAYEDNIVNKTLNIVSDLQFGSRGEAMLPKERAENRLKIMSEYYAVLAENPNEFNQDVIARKVLDRVRGGLYKTQRPKVFGIDIPNQINLGPVSVPIPMKDEVVPNPDFALDAELVTPEELQRAKQRYPQYSDEFLKDKIKVIKRRQKTGN